MSLGADSDQLPVAPRGLVPRALWHTLGLIAATLLAYLIWRGYQNPDLIIDLAAMRFC